MAEQIKKDSPQVSIDLSYAENRNQNPAFLMPGDSDDPLAMSKFLPAISGDPSYISLADGDYIVHILRFLTDAFWRTYGAVPYIVIAGKHANPCGIAIDWKDRSAVIRKALSGNKVAIMGGEVVTNFAIDDHLGIELFRQPPELCQAQDKKWGLDLILAPSFSPATVKLLNKKEKRRLLANPALERSLALEYIHFFPKKEWMLKNLFNGNDVLKQRFPSFVFTLDDIVSQVGKPMLLEDDDFDSLLIAWVAAWFASSNTVALAKDSMLIGLGCGQQDRIECVRLCINRANQSGHDTKGSVFASDAFFPFAQGETSGKDIDDIKDKMAFLSDFIAKTGKITEIKDFDEIMKTISRNDHREGPQLLADAGCIGGVVPADGNKLEEVQKFFQEKGMSVAFVHKDNRGFSKH